MRQSNRSPAPIGKESRLPRRSLPTTCVRIVFVGYLIALSVLLLSRDPAALVGVPPKLLELLSPVVHLLTFLGLGMLALAARWPVAGWALVLCLVAYAAGTELLQGLVAGRTAEWSDWFQDVAGIATGAAIYLFGLVPFQHVMEVRCKRGCVEEK